MRWIWFGLGYGEALVGALLAVTAALLAGAGGVSVLLRLLRPASGRLAHVPSVAYRRVRLGSLVHAPAAGVG